jgi:hypothetical protein
VKRSREEEMRGEAAMVYHGYQGANGVYSIDGSNGVRGAAYAVCPHCGQTDAVRKVSAVVSEGTTWSEQMGVAPNLLGSDLYLVGMHGTAMTRLAERLAPQVRRPGGVGWRVFAAAVAVLLGSTMACGLSTFAVTPEFGRFACGNWVLGILLVAGIGTVVPLLSIRGVRRQQAAYDAMMERARARWGALYYCARDDVAFDPAQSTVIPISALSAYLYS